MPLARLHREGGQYKIQEEKWVRDKKDITRNLCRKVYGRGSRSTSGS